MELECDALRLHGHQARHDARQSFAPHCRLAGNQSARRGHADHRSRYDALFRPCCRNRRARAAGHRRSAGQGSGVAWQSLGQNVRLSALRPCQRAVAGPAFLWFFPSEQAGVCRRSWLSRRYRVRQQRRER